MAEPKQIGVKDLTPEEARKLWTLKVMETAKDRCQNCGSEDKLSVKMIIPLEAGGQYVQSNGHVACRVCEMAAEAVASGRAEKENRRPLNFWVSRTLYASIQDELDRGTGFNGMGVMVRTLMRLFVKDPSRFDDLPLYKSDGSEVKVNVWVDADWYSLFKDMVAARDMTVTDGVKALITMYVASAAPQTWRE